MSEHASIDRFAWFICGMWFALISLIVFASLFAVNPTQEKVTRGWFEHQGKIYRVVPAEVR